MQQTNFMDRGLGVYGGPFYKKLRAEGDKAYLLIPMPLPESVRN